MAAVVTINLEGWITGDDGGSRGLGPFVYGGPDEGSMMMDNSYALAAGDTLIAVPQSVTPKGVIVFCPTGNTIPISFRTVLGDLGRPIKPDGYYFMLFDLQHVPNQIYLNALQPISLLTQVVWF